ncbi:hypothetical protein OTU49_003695 [Cherax quadricarinatus]|uniref:Secreted protein n=1 Tax=Cherax quadricarinatus TaxID=27406 RepID=A0AAW0X2N3_CHEQU
MKKMVKTVAWRNAGARLHGSEVTFLAGVVITLTHSICTGTHLFVVAGGRVTAPGWWLVVKAVHKDHLFLLPSLAAPSVYTTFNVETNLCRFLCLHPYYCIMV